MLFLINKKMNSKQDYIHPARHKDQKVKKMLKLELQKQNTAVSGKNN